MQSTKSVDSTNKKLTLNIMKQSFFKMSNLLIKQTTARSCAKTPDFAFLNKLQKKKFFETARATLHLKIYHIKHNVIFFYVKDRELFYV